MKFLQMFSKMNNTNGGQMVFGIEKPIVDFDKIYDYCVVNGVYDEKCKYLGYTIKCKSNNGVYYLAPPLDYRILYDQIRDLKWQQDREGKLKSEDEVSLKIKEELFNTHIKSIETFIPFMLKAFKLSDDGTMLKVVIKDDEWALEEL